MGRNGVEIRCEEKGLEESWEREQVLLLPSHLSDLECGIFVFQPPSPPFIIYARSFDIPQVWKIVLFFQLLLFYVCLSVCFYFCCVQGYMFGLIKCFCVVAWYYYIAQAGLKLVAIPLQSPDYVHAPALVALYLIWGSATLSERSWFMCRM